MRIVIICLIVAIASMVAIFTLDFKEEKTEHQVAAGETVVAHPPATEEAGESAAQEHAVVTGEQSEPAEPTADGIAAQHTEQAQPMEQTHGQEQSHVQEQSATAAPHQVHWGYKGEGGPSNWGKLSADYAMCGSGLNQSPINLTSFVEAELPPLTFNYAGMAVEIVNNGHTVQANYHPGSNLVVDGRIFHLKQFHFHSPSENLLSGKSYPLEAHFVHADEDGDLAVVAVLFADGEENRTLSMFWDQLPQAGSSAILAAQVKATDLLPEDRDYYRFNGSLTTPPCSQGVIWLVMKQALPVSGAQVEKFTKLMGGPNNRPVQPLNARMVLQ
jgi:carbonic anhydrase